MRSALREGYHRQVGPLSGFTPIEIEMRKRLFYTIYKLDIYVNAMLGLPRSISPDDFDQTLPIELSDENITEHGYLPENQNGVLSSTGIANQHTKLLMILNSIVRELYPIKKTNNLISHETVTRLELKLRTWMDELPTELVPNLENIPAKYERANKLLHLSFLHVQIILYRPFIHYLSRNFVDMAPDTLSLQRARNSINVARSAVKLAQEMLSKNLISGSYWYASYTIFYSVAGLLFYIHEAQLPDTESAREYYDILKDAEIGRNVLNQIKDSSMAATRTYNLLNKLFEKLNSKTIKLTTMYNSPSHQSPTTATNQGELSYQERPQSQIQNNFNRQGNDNMLTNFTVPSYPEDIQIQPTTSNPQQHQQPQLQLQQSPASNLSAVSMTNNASNTFLPQPTKTPNQNGTYPKLEKESDQVPLTDIFGFNGNPNDILSSATGDADTIGLESSVNSYSNNGLSNTNLAGSNNDKIKAENLDEAGILNVFDQLDAHLFGKYMPLNYQQDDLSTNPTPTQNQDRTPNPNQEV